MFFACFFFPLAAGLAFMVLLGVPKEPSERGWGTGFSSLKEIQVVDIYLWDCAWALLNMANLI